MPDDEPLPPAPEASAPRPHPGVDHWAHLLGAYDRLPIDPDLEPGQEPDRGPGLDPGSLRSPADRADDAPAHRRPRPRPRPRILAAIFAGGCLGTLARYGVGQAWPTPSGHFPTATFVINTSGSLLLGLVLTVLLERYGDRAPAVRRFAGAGVLGGWTTYSTLVVDALALAKVGDVPLAAGYVALTLVSGVSAVALGIALGRSRAATRLPAGGGEVVSRGRSDQGRGVEAAWQAEP